MRKALYSIIVCVGFALIWPLSASAVTVYDNYWGSDDHGYRDLIEDSGTDYFDIFRAEVSHSTNLITLDIHTQFAGRGNDGLFSNYTPYGNGIGYGDLFLAGGWTPDTRGSNYEYDDASTGTSWEYVFHLDNRWSDSSSGGLYAIDSGVTLLSEDFMSEAIYRNGQEVAYSPGSSENPIDGSEWSVHENEDFIRFIIDISGTTLAGSDTIAFHWGQTCANDVIEGEFTLTPEPATMLLFGTGLLCLAGFGRKKFFPKKG